MPQRFAFEVEINQYRVIQLPMEVPVGRALLLVVVPDPKEPDRPAPAETEDKRDLE